MRYVLVCADEFLWDLLPPVGGGDDRIYVVDNPALRARIIRHGTPAVAGDLTRPAVYRRTFRSGQEPVVVAVDAARQPAVVRAIRQAAPTAPLLVLTDTPGRLRAIPGVTTLPSCAFADRVVAPEVERALTRARVERIRGHLAGRARVLIMMQDDPDPDAIASAVALRALLGQRADTAPIATFGAITRPENRAMTEILRIDVERIAAADVRTFDGVAIVDAQPAFFEEPVFDRVDLVIDHHPETRPVRAVLKDVRPGYGATSTILVEYLQAAEIPLAPRLATALLYGIKTDTRGLERGATKADLEAFVALHARANRDALRRIERPELPPEALDALARGLQHRTIVDGVVFSDLGRVGYPELVAQFADLFLQVRGAEWSVVSGTIRDELHISVRTTGTGRAAGAVVREAFGDLGRAGGHRTMAKAVVQLGDWRARDGAVSASRRGQRIVRRFRRALAR